jgi:hypothetical protein
MRVPVIFHSLVKVPENCTNKRDLHQKINVTTALIQVKFPTDIIYFRINWNRKLHDVGTHHFDSSCRECEASLFGLNRLYTPWAVEPVGPNHRLIPQNELVVDLQWKDLSLVNSVFSRMDDDQSMQEDLNAAIALSLEGGAEWARDYAAMEPDHEEPESMQLAGSPPIASFMAASAGNKT